MKNKKFLTLALAAFIFSGNVLGMETDSPVLLAEAPATADLAELEQLIRNAESAATEWPPNYDAARISIGLILEKTYHLNHFEPNQYQRILKLIGMCEKDLVDTRNHYQDDCLKLQGELQQLKVTFTKTRDDLQLVQSQNRRSLRRVIVAIGLAYAAGKFGLVERTFAALLQLRQAQ
jgi:hypothetical protein